MSGNPFRRGTSASSRLPDEDVPAITSENATKKRVQIKSPPQSPGNEYPPQLEHRQISDSSLAERADIPPPRFPSIAELEQDDPEPLSSADTELRAADLDARPSVDNAASPDGGLFSQRTSVSGVKAPYNPFARTLATQEASVGLQATRARAGEGDDTDRGQTAGRQTMDVDAFKNMLLTGSPAPALENASNGVSRTRDEGGGFEKPSADRHFYETPHSPHSDSPRASSDEYEESSNPALPDDGESDHLAPPAPSKSKPRVPQTVSFADFDQNIPQDFHAPLRSRPSADLHPHSILRPPSIRTASPSSSIISRRRSTPPQNPFQQQIPQAENVVVPDSPQPQLSEAAASSKKVPPPPPASRRQVPVPGRPRSATGSSTASDPNLDDVDSAPALDQTANRKTITPLPPPPSRKPVPTPPPPPRRNPSKLTIDRPPLPRNTSTTSSNSSTTAAAAAATSTLPPPPPPPRRIGNSNRSSVDGGAFTSNPPPTGRRSSAQSVGSDRSSGLGRYVVAAGEGEAARASGVAEEVEGEEPFTRDLLADISALQAEVEALRARSGHGGS